MSLDVQLSPFLAKQLYKNALYDFSSESNASLPGHIGGYAKRILILVAENSFPFISDTDLEFLGKVLLPCGLAMSDVALVNVEKQADPAGQVIPHFLPEKVILFGVGQDKLGLPLQFPHFQVQPFNGCTYLAAPALSALQNDATAKKDLWMGLKKLFSLS